LSIALQYGVPLEVLVNKFSHTRFEPMGHTTNKEIRIAKSVVDYIARWLGLTFLTAHPEFGTQPHAALPGEDTIGNGPAVDFAASLVSSAVAAAGRKQGASGGETASGSSGRTQLNGPMDQFARFQSDAPGCDNCGSITVRNGNCY